MASVSRILVPRRDFLGLLLFHAYQKFVANLIIATIVHGVKSYGPRR